MSEENLIRRIRQGDTALFEDLIRLYYDDIYKYMCFKTGNADIAYDLTQETFLRVLRYFESYRGRGKFKSYIFQIAGNVCNDFYKQYVDEVFLDEIEKDGKAAGGDCISEYTDKLAVYELLHQLPEYQREVIIYKYFLGYKIREIAEITNELVPTVKSRLKQGLDKMRRLAEKNEGRS